MDSMQNASSPFVLEIYFLPRFFDRLKTETIRRIRSARQREFPAKDFTVRLQQGYRKLICNLARGAMMNADQCLT